jgi:PAS domain S-box-containing protein
MSPDAPTSAPGSELRRVRSLIADLDAIVWEADARSCAWEFVSEGATEILGHTPREWLSLPTFWADHLHPEDRERAMATFMEAATRGAPFDMEYRMRAKDGTTVWIRDLGHVVRDADQRPFKIRGLMVEITEMKHLEEQRREAESRFQRVVERLPAIVYIEGVEADRDEPGRMLYVSPQVRDILGFTPEAWMADPLAWARQIHPEDLPRVHDEYRRVRAGGAEPFVADYRMIAQDGRQVAMHDEAVPVHDEEGRPLFRQGILYDVTAMRASESRAAQTEARYRSLVEQLPAVVYSEPVEGNELTMMYIGPRIEEILGVTAAEWMARPEVWFETMYPDDRERVAAENARTEASGEPFRAEYRSVARDGRVVWFRDEARLVLDEEGRPLCWQGVMFDVSDQHRTEQLERDLALERETAQRLRDLDDMKNTFLQAVSHDFRTPLAAILGLAVTMERNDVELDTDEVHDMAKRIVANARKLDRLVNDLLDLDRLSRGIVEPLLKPTDLGDLIRNLVGESELIATRKVTLEVQPVTVPVDAAKVERIVENLLANPTRHTPADAQVWVRVEPMGDGALIVVEDDGPGVPEDVRDRIFEPFQQGPTPVQHSPGVGVGLTLVARFAELHGGRAWVQERPGGGASFRVYLAGTPASDLASSSPSASQL